MAGKGRPHPLYIAFLAMMVLLLVIGAFMLIWGSTHNTVPAPTLTGPGQFAGRALHA